MLPLEAIELDAFRRRHEHDTFWCGLLLGGCGDQLTTKLYTDRACHFAHYPDPDGLEHVCRRRSRGVASADHLYVKSAAAAWLRERGKRAHFDFTQPGKAPLGSVVDIQWQGGGLRVHLDQAVAPVWDQEGSEPVLGVSVPVDRDTLIRRWYVHRIRLDSEGTTRRVRIGTEAFTRPTEWFALDECEMTERGLSTPAVERIVRARSTPPPSRWSAGKARKAPEADARAQGLLRRLADARRVDSVVMVTRVCREIADLTGVSQETQAQLDTAVQEANCWLEEQAEVRRDLFARLDQAVTAQNPKQVRELLIRVNATAAHDRNDAEDSIVNRADGYFAGLGHATHARMTAEAAAQRAAADAVGHVRNILKDLRRDNYTYDLRSQVEVLIRYADIAGDRLTARQAREIAIWKKRAGLSSPVGQSDGGGGQQPKRRKPLHKQVARRHWIKRSCPRCHASEGKDCVIDDGTGNSEVRHVPHDERLQPIVDERVAGQRQSPRRWRVYEVTCPDCGKAPGARCASPSGGVHRSRVELARENTRKGLRP